MSGRSPEAGIGLDFGAGLIAMIIIGSVRSSYSHPDLLVIHPTFSDHTGPQHWTFTF